MRFNYHRHIGCRKTDFDFSINVESQSDKLVQTAFSVCGSETAWFTRFIPVHWKVKLDPNVEFACFWDWPFKSAGTKKAWPDTQIESSSGGGGGGRQREESCCFVLVAVFPIF